MKDAYYFTHDANSRNDEKVIALRAKHGWEGFGIFWALIEKLREAKNYQCIKDYNLVAFDLRVDASKVKSIIEDFGLFVFTECGKYFYSDRLNRNMDYKEIRSEKARESAKKRWEKLPEKQIENANVMRTHSEGNAMKVKESKVKEIKGEGQQVDNTHPPELVESYKKFNNWLSEHTPRVLELKHKITIEQYQKLKSAYPDMKQPVATLKAMHNFKPLTKNYVDAYLTLVKWMKKDEQFAN
jgi:hypothetical protein